MRTGELVWEHAAAPLFPGQDGWWLLRLQEQMPEDGELVITLQTYTKLFLDDWQVEQQPSILVALTDYYPFGSPMPGRRWEREQYRFGFNGMEKDDKLKGAGNSYDFGARMLDPRVGRWLSVDPLANHPNQVDKSPYAAMWNNPVKLRDPDGRCPWCWGAVVGGAVDYGLQVAVNFAEGKTGLEAFTNIDKGSVLVSVGAGALSGGFSIASKLNTSSKFVRLASSEARELVIDAASSVTN